MDLNTLLIILVGIVLFIFGIENFSKEIQRAAGSWLNNILRKAVKNKWQGSFFGFLTTAIVNSSTATTLIAISLVNAGLISFAQSLPIIFGANVGSTITAQLIAFKLTKFAIVFLLIGFILTFISKTKFFGRSLFYFGLVFFALNLISDAVTPFSKDPRILEFFFKYNNFFILIFVSFLFTILVNSSALTLGLIIVLASKGFFGLNESFFLILGANLGTTISTLLASFRMDLYAKRTAVAHFLFNFLGVILILPFVPFFLKLILFFGGSIERQIANAHLFFNFSVALVFLIYLNSFKKLVDFLVKGNEEEIILSPKYLTEKLPSKNEEAFVLIEKELRNAMENNEKVLFYSKEFLEKKDEKILRKIKKLCRLSNIISHSIGNALFELSTRKLNEQEAKRILYLVRLNNSVEQLGDLAGDLAFLPDKLLEKNFAEAIDYKQINNLFDFTLFIFKKLKADFPHSIERDFFDSLKTKKIIAFLDKEYYLNLKDLRKEKYVAGSFFVESCSIIENILFKLKEIGVLIKNFKHNKNV
ncbi:MAG: Na/Pi cotransporter family protein [Candidatus Pacearchaeota archaeon]